MKKILPNVEESEALTAHQHPVSANELTGTLSPPADFLGPLTIPVKQIQRQSHRIEYEEIASVGSLNAPDHREVHVELRPVKTHDFRQDQLRIVNSHRR